MRVATSLGILAVAAIALAACTAPTAGGVHIQDIHGLALDPDDPGRLYVATHHGLFVGEQDTTWSAVTEQPFDMMGFSMHPRDADVMYASGHPGRSGQGWAVGVVRSIDAGRTWTTLSLRDQVDFHAMAMEPGADIANDTVYGFHAGKLHVSADGAATWSTRGLAFPIASLAVTPGTGDIWAATPAGIMKNVRLATGAWETVAPRAASAVAADGGHGVFAYFDNGGLFSSPDHGATWTALNWTVPAGDHPWGIAPGPDGSATVYVGTARGTIHKTSDGGASWTRVR